MDGILFVLLAVLNLGASPDGKEPASVIAIFKTETACTVAKTALETAAQFNEQIDRFICRELDMGPLEDGEEKGL